MEEEVSRNRFSVFAGAVIRVTISLNRDGDLFVVYKAGGLVSLEVTENSFHRLKMCICGFELNCESCWIEYAKSGHIRSIAYIIEPTIPLGKASDPHPHYPIRLL